MSTIRIDRTNPGKYEILGRLGRGGMGEVYKVRHRLLHETRAIKIMRTDGAESSARLERFVREARIAADLSHPHIAKLFDFALASDGRAFMVLEWVDGVTLKDWLSASGPPPVDWALQVARQALDALGYLHDRGVIHRDISPDNLMVSAEVGHPVVKLIDLGLAKQVSGGSSLTEDGQFLGKLRYAPPEAFNVRGSRAGVDHRADIYAMGVVLYELLTGRYPFEATSRESIVGAQIGVAPTPFSEVDPDGRIPEQLRKSVLRALEKNPDHRHQTAGSFAASLDAVGQKMTTLDLPSALEDLRTLEAPTEALQSGSSVREAQQDLDFHFTVAEKQEFDVPEPSTQLPRGSESDRPVVGGRLDTGTGRPPSSSEKSSVVSTVVRAVRDHPVSFAALGSLILVAVVVLALVSSTTTSAVPVKPLQQATDGESQSADESSGTGDLEAGSASTGGVSSEATVAAVALVDPTGAAAARLIPFLAGTGLEAKLYLSLQDAVSDANQRDHPLLSVQLEIHRDSGTSEAYGVQLPTCEVTGSLLILSLPEMGPVLIETMSRRAPGCGEAEEQVVRSLGAIAARTIGKLSS